MKYCGNAHLVMLLEGTDGWRGWLSAPEMILVCSRDDFGFIESLYLCRRAL